MAHDVFVSYPHVDKTTADAVVNALENAGLRCWVAPRDVPIGDDWAGAIVEAIGASRLLVLVFSDATNTSDHILREVRAAGDAGIAILPFRTADVEPNPALKYYVGGLHWLDALTGPLEEHLGALAATASDLLATPGRPRPGEPWSGGALPGVGPAQMRSGAGWRGWLERLSVPARAGMVALLAVLLLVGGVVVAGGWGSDDTGTTAPTPGPSAATSEDLPGTDDPADGTTDATAPDTAGGPVFSRSFTFVGANVQGPDPVCTVRVDAVARCDYLDLDTITNDVAVADFDLDGEPDIAFAHAMPETGEAATDVVQPQGRDPQMARNRVCLAGSGGWDCRDVSDDELRSNAVVAADLDLDGDPDLVFGNALEGVGLAPMRAQVCLNDGDARFACSPIDDVTVETGANPQSESLVVGDVDLDGNPDIVLPLSGWPNQVCYGDGLGAFSCVDLDDEQANTVDAAVADFSGMGFPDILFTNYGSPNRLCNQNPDTTFSCSDISGPENPSTSVAAYPAYPDVRGDGYAEAYIGRGDWGSDFRLEDEALDHFCRFDGPNGNPSCAPVSDIGSVTMAVLVEDLDQDGTADVLSIGSSTVACIGGEQGLDCTTIEVPTRTDDRGVVQGELLRSAAVLSVG